MKHIIPLSALLLLAACAAEPEIAEGIVGDDGAGGGKADRVTVEPDWNRDIVWTGLTIDLSELTGRASIQLEPDSSETASFQVAGLTIKAVSGDDGPLDYDRTGRDVHVDVGRQTTLTIDYTLELQSANNGLLAGGSTVTWPYHCGNLYPCKSDPSDGMAFSLELTGVPDGMTAIYPRELTTDTAAYTLAWAVGEYTCEDLGQTDAGTTVRTCWLPKGKTRALKGTGKLLKSFDWLETHIGPYAFGDEVSAVAVVWGESDAGGMEHHPHWHVALDSMEDRVTQAHEAAHGWYGAGVRIRCWEDFVLSEGTVSYLSARAMAEVSPASVEEQIWADYREELELTLEDEDIIAWPDSCGEVDLLKDGLFSNIVYMKGAFFYKAVADEIGAETLDQVLSDFYMAGVGQARGMQEMLDAIEADTGFDPRPLADHWLRSKGNPWDL